MYSAVCGEPPPPRTADLTSLRRSVAHATSGSHNREGALISGRLILIVVSLLALLSCSKPPETRPEPPPVKVGMSKVEQGELAKKLHVSGPLQFIANTTVSAEVSGRVESILVSDGQDITKGTLLLVFDDTKIRETFVHAGYTLQRDESTLALNKKEYERNLALFEKGTVSQTAHDQKFAEYKNSLAQVEMDRAVYAKAIDDLKKTRVKSPISGRISRRFVELGDWVDEGGKLFQVSDYKKIYLNAHLSGLDIAKLDLKRIRREGVPAEVVVDPYPDKVFQGRLTYVEPVADETRLFETRIYLDNPEMLLLQGMFGRGVIRVKNLEGIVRVPVAALLDQIRNNKPNSVFVVDGTNAARLRRIKIGVSNRRFAQVTEGLKAGETVIVRGKEVLTDGQKVEAADSEQQ